MVVTSDRAARTLEGCARAPGVCGGGDEALDLGREAAGHGTPRRDVVEQSLWAAGVYAHSRVVRTPAVEGGAAVGVGAVDRDLGRIGAEVVDIGHVAAAPAEIEQMPVDAGTTTVSGASGAAEGVGCGGAVVIRRPPCQWDVVVSATLAAPNGIPSHPSFQRKVRVLW